MNRKVELAQFAMNLEQASTVMAQAFAVVVQPQKDGNWLRSCLSHPESEFQRGPRFCGWRHWHATE